MHACTHARSVVMGEVHGPRGVRDLGLAHLSRVLCTARTWQGQVTRIAHYLWCYWSVAPVLWGTMIRRR